MKSACPVILALLAFACAGCDNVASAPTGVARAASALTPNPVLKEAATPASSPAVAVSQPRITGRQSKIVTAARRQIGDAYVADYVSLSYPGGDVPARTGACTDVVVRSLRSVGTDLQKTVHEDMKANFRLYPKRWGLRRPDSNIDHRRVPNLVVFFKRFGISLPTGVKGADRSTWQPGDVVIWVLDNGRDHCGIVTEATGASGLPTVVHNLGPCAEEDCLTAWRIVGHYRYPKNR